MPVFAARLALSTKKWRRPLNQLLQAAKKTGSDCSVYCLVVCGQAQGQSLSDHNLSVPDHRLLHCTTRSQEGILRAIEDRRKSIHRA